MDRYTLHTHNPNFRDLKKIAERIHGGEILIFPTDSIYAMGCVLSNKKGIDRIIKITGKKEKHARMSLICRDISMASQYASLINNQAFKMMKRTLPGPFTFIFSSSIQLQRQFKNSKREIGVRIPDHEVVQTLLTILGEPIISTSLNMDDEIQPYYIDPEVIEEKFQHNVDILVEDGMGSYSESTVIDFTSGVAEIVREGKGDIKLL